MSTLGSDYDTLLAVYTGSSLSGLTVVGSNDNAATGDTTSRVQFTAVAGQTYIIAVDGTGGATSLTACDPPSGYGPDADDCNDADAAGLIENPVSTPHIPALPAKTPLPPASAAR